MPTPADEPRPSSSPPLRPVPRPPAEGPEAAPPGRGRPPGQGQSFRVPRPRSGDQPAPVRPVESAAEGKGRPGGPGGPTGPGGPGGPHGPAGRRRHGRITGAPALLAAAVSLPVAALVLPHTMAYVLARALVDLDLAAAQADGVVRAGGLALPAVLLVLPSAALAARRFPAWTVLLTGLVSVLAGSLLVRQADSVIMIAIARCLQGAGAGAIVPATLVLVWRRAPRWPAAAWAGGLVGVLILAMPLALRAVPPARSGSGAQAAGAAWRSALHPPLGLIGLALAAAAFCGFAALRHRSTTPMSDSERGQLLLPLVPAGGFAFLAVVTTYDRWSEEALLVVALIGLLALVGLAIVGTRNATGGGELRCALAMITIGLAVFPAAGPLTGLIGTASEPSEIGLTPFVLGATAALSGAILTVLTVGSREDGPRFAVLVGHGLLIIAVLAFLTVGAGSGGVRLALAFVPLGAGAGIVLSAALWEAGLGPALFASALCPPAVLVGYLVVGPLEMLKVEAVREARGGPGSLVLGLTSAFRLWSIVLGVIIVIMAVLAALAGRTFLAREDRPDDQEA